MCSRVQLILKCKPISQALFEKTKLDKVLPKLLKRGNESTKSLVQAVLDYTTGKGSGTKAVPKEVIVPTSKLSSAASGPSSLVRRDVDPGALKKSPGPVAGDKPSLVGKDAGTAKAAGGAKADGKATESAGSAGSSVAARTVDAKSVYAGLLSASKKSKLGGSTASQKAPKPSDSKKVAGSNEAVRSSESSARAAEPAPAKPSFSFADAMASLNKPKEAEATKKPPEERPNETPEERKARLRKESRRHLRVGWKPDSTLVETRYFTHDPDEELDMDHDAVRADLQNEGKMLKRGLSQSVEEEEEEEERANGAELMPWRAPSLSDFGDLQALEDARDNLISRGGKQEPRSEEQDVQRQREMNTLIAIYPTKADIPDTPREPANPYSGPEATETAFGEPPDDVKVRI